MPQRPPTPDFSHLSDAEVEVIVAVLRRLRDEEEQELERERSEDSSWPDSCLNRLNCALIVALIGVDEQGSADSHLANNVGHLCFNTD